MVLPRQVEPRPRVHHAGVTRNHQDPHKFESCRARQFPLYPSVTYARPSCTVLVGDADCVRFV
jgi:hypothetical protein